MDGSHFRYGIILGFSGGPDSVCLLHKLYKCMSDSNESDYRVNNLIAVHINHMLRGDEALRDEAFARHFCDSLGVKLICVREDVPAYAADRKISIEAAAREVRYRALERIRRKTEAETGRAWRIAVAHNKDDLAETVLMNILRGAGVDGLRGMDGGGVLSDDIAMERNADGENADSEGAYTGLTKYVVRPLLGVERREIMEYLEQNHLGYMTDSSNADVSFTRNRIRAELMPALRKDFNPEITDALCRLSENAGQDSGYLKSEAVRAYRECLIDGVYPSVALSSGALNVLHPAIASRVIRIAAANAGGVIRRLGSVHVGLALDLARTGRTGAVLHLPGGMRIRRSYDSIILYTVSDKGINGVPCQGLYITPDGAPPGSVIKSLHIRNFEIVEQIKNISYNSLVQFFDADALCSDKLDLRHRRAGDYFYPIKSPGAKKLKDFFIDAKIPREIRNTVCLLASGPEVVWVIGYRVSERYKVTDQTLNVLEARYAPG